MVMLASHPAPLLYSSYLSHPQFEDSVVVMGGPLNHLKRNGFCMYHQALYQKPYVPPEQYNCVYCVVLGTNSAYFLVQN